MNLYGYKRSRKRMMESIRSLEERIDFLKKDMKKPLRIRESGNDNDEIKKEILRIEKRINNITDAKKDCLRRIKELEKKGIKERDEHKRRTFQHSRRRGRRKIRKKKIKIKKKSK